MLGTLTIQISNNKNIPFPNSFDILFSIFEKSLSKYAGISWYVKHVHIYKFLMTNNNFSDCTKHSQIRVTLQKQMEKLRRKRLFQFYHCELYN